MAVTQTRPASSVGMVTWGTAILKGVQAPVNSNNLQKLAAWNACEDGPASQARNNPFNTTLGGYMGASNPYGGVSINSARVQLYPDFNSGVRAIVDSLQNTAAFTPIVRNLQQNGSFSDFVAALGGSGWGTRASCVAGASNTPVTGNDPTAAQMQGTQGQALAATGLGTNGAGSGAAPICQIGFKTPAIGTSITGNLLNSDSICLWQAGWTRALLGGVLLGTAGIVGLAALFLMINKELPMPNLPGPAGGIAAGVKRVQSGMSRPSFNPGSVSFPERPANLKNKNLTSGRFIKKGTFE